MVVRGCAGVGVGPVGATCVSELLGSGVCACEWAEQANDVGAREEEGHDVTGGAHGDARLCWRGGRSRGGHVCE